LLLLESCVGGVSDRSISVGKPERFLHAHPDIVVSLSPEMLSLLILSIQDELFGIPASILTRASKYIQHTWISLQEEQQVMVIKHTASPYLLWKVLKRAGFSQVHTYYWVDDINHVTIEILNRHFIRMYIPLSSEQLQTLSCLSSSNRVDLDESYPLHIIFFRTDFFRFIPYFQSKISFFLNKDHSMIIELQTENQVALRVLGTSLRLIGEFPLKDYGIKFDIDTVKRKDTRLIIKTKTIKKVVLQEFFKTVLQIWKNYHDTRNN